MQFFSSFGLVLATLSPVLLLPIGLTLWARQKALQASTLDQATVWFSFVRFLRWQMLGTLVLWWVMTDLIAAHHYVDLLFPANAPSVLPGSNIFSLFLLWLPPMLAVIFCQVLARPVYSGVRGIEWTRSDLVRQAALTLGMTLIPILFVTAGFQYLFRDDDLRGLLLCYLVAFFICLFSARGLRSLLQLKPNALTTGDLRDRVFALAASLGVKLQQLYVLPAGKMRLANAFARAGNSILLTDYLLTHLSKREVDFVVAHELAHLKRNHPRKLGLAYLGGLVPVLLASFLLPRADSIGALFDIFYVLSPLCVYYFVARRFEFTVDADAVKLTGDPEAAASCLVKIHHLNLMPTQWGKLAEKFLTHPSTVRRAQAIARAVGIPSERLPHFLETALAPSSLRQPGEPDRYPLPRSFVGEGKVFSTEFKQRAYWRNYFAHLGAITLVPALYVWLVRSTGWPVPGWTISLIGFLVASGVTLFFTNFLSLAGYNSLHRRLREKFERDGVKPTQWEGILVGFSPDPSPRIYEMNYSWDTGFLFLIGDTVCYWGEEARFALRREEIVSVRLGPGIPNWLHSQNLYITWRDGASNSEATFNLRPVNVRSLLQMKSKVRALARRIGAWQTSSSPSSNVPSVFADLEPPSIGKVTGVSCRQNLKPRQIFMSFLFVGFLAGCAGSLLGLPVDVTTPIALIFGFVPPEHADMAGWYVVLIAWLALLFSLVPHWLYSEKSRPSSGSAAHPHPVPGHE